MCRIAAYLGPELDLQHFVAASPHSLYRQSWAPREMHTAVVNADGWGAAWLAADGLPAVYRHTNPIWADPNLAGLGRSLRSRLWLANVRSATEGLGTHDVNTQPFIDDRLLFVHNGFIGGFAHSLRRQLRNALHESIEATVAGNTDSEHLFGLIRQHPGDLETAVRAAVNWVGEQLAGSETTALLNLIVSDGAELVATRAAFGGDCPSLYWHPGHPGYGGGRLVASEAFDDDPGWRALAPQHLLSLRGTADNRVLTL